MIENKRTLSVTTPAFFSRAIMVQHRPVSFATRHRALQAQPAFKIRWRQTEQASTAAVDNFVGNSIASAANA